MLTQNAFALFCKSPYWGAFVALSQGFPAGLRMGPRRGMEGDWREKLRKEEKRKGEKRIERKGREGKGTAG